MRKLVLLFVVAVMAQAQGQACNRILTSSAGTISSPSYPLNYPPNQDCSYVITAQKGSRVTLTVVFRTQPGLNGCDRDYIQFKQSYGHIYVRFVSDFSVSSTGFLATYTTGAVSQRYLFMANTGLRAVHRYDIDTGSNYLLPLAASPLNPIGVDYDPVKDRVYWTDVAERTIRSAFLNGTGVQLVRNIGPGAVPDGVAVDYLSRLLIYTDAGNRLIAMQTLSGSKYKVIINTNIERPRDIELDKCNGNMATTSYLQRISTDGRSGKTIGTAPGRLNDVVTVDDSADKGPNVCTVNNGGCSSTYICMPAAFNTKKCLAQDVSVVPGPRVKRSLPTNENDVPPVGLVGVKNLNQTGEVDNLVPSSGSDHQIRMTQH